MALKPKNNAVLFILVMCLPALFAWGEASPAQKTDFLTFANGGGTSVDDAVTIIVKDMGEAVSAQERVASFKKISEEEYLYLNKRFGDDVGDWELVESDNCELDIAANDKYYDDVTVRISDGTELEIYFDITEPVKAINGED